MLEIKNYLPQRYPFLMVDRVEKIDANEIIGFKNLTINEQFFHGHFPGYPIMPGVLVIEALAQISGILVVYRLKKQSDKSDVVFEFMLVGVDKARFKKQVVPGDQLMLHAKIVKNKGKIFYFDVYSSVKDQITSKAEVMLADVTRSPA